MSFDLQIKTYRTYLHVTMTGDMAQLATENAIVAIGEAALKAHLPRILVDWRQVVNIQYLTIAARFESSRFLAEQVARLRARGLHDVRIVNVTPEVRSDAEEFSETVAINRGVALKMMDDMAGALAWLGVDEQDAPGSG